MGTNIKITPEWKKNKDRIWAEKFAGLDESPGPQTIPLSRNRFFLYTAAAVITILIALPSIAFFHTKSIETPNGERIVALLPDGSEVTLNAGTSITYKPYWWRLDREVKMEGEAYFKVTKGSKFSVESPNGTVAVLGTSFNIFDRAEQYRVTCLTGKVSVASRNRTTTLHPGMSAYAEGNDLSTAANKDPYDKIGWIHGNFSFISEPLKNVITEIERQYDIRIEIPQNIDYLYTGNFSRDVSPEEALNIIGKPFGITLSIEK